MAERMAAEIEIGGKIAVGLVPELCRIIGQAGVGLEYGSYNFRPASAEDLLAARRDTDDVLLLIDDQSRWGEFPDLEAFLREHNIPYTRRTEPKYEYDGELVEFRPGSEPVVITTNAAGHPVVSASVLAEVDAALAQALECLTKGPGSVGSAIKPAKRAQQLLRDHLPPPVPPLEPFEIKTAKTPEEAHGQ